MSTPHHRLAMLALTVSLAAAACASDSSGAADPVPQPGSDPAGTGVPADTAPDGGGEPVDEPAPAEPDAGDEATGAPDIESIEIEASRYNPLGAEVTVRTTAPGRVQLTAAAGDHQVSSPVTAATASEHVLPLVGLRAERDYVVDVELVDETGEPIATASSAFSTGPLPDDLLDYEFFADPARSSPGVTLLEVQPDGDQYVFGVDGDGEVVFYYRNAGVVGGLEPTDRGTFLSHYWPVGVREFDVLGDVVGNWQFQSSGIALPTGPPTSDPAGEDSRAEVIDEDLLDQFFESLGSNVGDPPPVPIAPEWVELTSFHHEAWPMPDGNILTMSTTVHELTPEQRQAFCPGDESPFNVISDVMVEFEPSGRVVRTWDLWDAIDIDAVPGHALCNERGPFASADDRDWTHGNAAVYDPVRDAIIVSSRHTNQVIALRHLDAEGPQSDVLWIFGEVGTVLVDGDLPYHQHAVEVQDDGSILLYDNGNDRPGTSVGDPENPTYSRAVLYAIDDTSDDPADWTVRQTWEHRTTDLDGSVLYARFLGDADRLENGNVLITHGGIDVPSVDFDQHAAVIEVVPEGEAGGTIVWDLRLGTPDAEATVYRAERIPSLYFGPLWDT